MGPIEKILNWAKAKVKPTKEAPNDPKVWVYSWFLKASKLPVFSWLEKLISTFFVKVAPNVPVNLKRSFTGAKGLHAGIIGFVLAFFFCFVVTVLGTWLNGTLFDDPNSIDNVRCFLNDKWNIFLYSFICPMYVGLTCWLVVVAVKGWGEIRAFKNEELKEEDKQTKFPLMKATALGFLILAVAFALTANYINDITKLAEIEKEYYWFFTKKNGRFELGTLGIYYFLLNYTLLIITLIALTFFMSIYSMMMKVGKALASKESIDELDFLTLKTKLSVFTEAYILAKLLVGAYIVNIMVWVASPLGGGGNGTNANIQVAVILMGIIGVFMISIPRYFVELQWYRLKNKSKMDNDLDVEYDDIRSFEIKLLATVLDTFLIGGFLVGYAKYIL
ncbi:MAG: hypothetical protein R2800_08520 [Flavipsychrobacter sp.]